MSKSDEQKLAALIRKNMAKAEKPKGSTKRRQYDATLQPEADDDHDPDRRAFFSEMKKREF